MVDTASATVNKAGELAGAANAKGGQAIEAAEGAASVVKDKAVEVSGAATDKAGQVVALFMLSYHF